MIQNSNAVNNEPNVINDSLENIQSVSGRLDSIKNPCCDRIRNEVAKYS